MNSDVISTLHLPLISVELAGEEAAISLYVKISVVMTILMEI